MPLSPTPTSPSVPSPSPSSPRRRQRLSSSFPSSPGNAALALSAGLASAAAAQVPSFTSDSTITMHMSWREADLQGNALPNPNDILEPGEHALILIDSVSFTNQGGLAHFAPPLGTFSSGTITAFGWGSVDINGTGGTEGMFNNSSPPANSTGTSGFGVRAPWRISGNGTVSPTGITNLQFSWFGEHGLPTTNPIPNMFRMLWTPASFSPRSVDFGLAGGSAAGSAIGAVYLTFDKTVGATIFVTPSNITLGSVSIPIIPAPPTILILLAAAPRRRRSRR